MSVAYALPTMEDELRPDLLNVLIVDDERAIREGCREVAADHAGQLVGLAVQSQRHAFDFFVVLHFDGEQSHHLYRYAGGATTWPVTITYP